MSEKKPSQGSKLLAAWRVKNGYTLDQAAEVLGFDRYMINRYEKGHHVPQGKRAIFIKNRCEIPVESWYL